MGINVNSFAHEEEAGWNASNNRSTAKEAECPRSAAETPAERLVRLELEALSPLHYSVGDSGHTSTPGRCGKCFELRWALRSYTRGLKQYRDMSDDEYAATVTFSSREQAISNALSVLAPKFGVFAKPRREIGRHAGLLHCLTEADTHRFAVDLELAVLAEVVNFVQRLVCNEERVLVRPEYIAQSIRVGLTKAKVVDPDGKRKSVMVRRYADVPGSESVTAADVAQILMFEIPKAVYGTAAAELLDKHIYTRLDGESLDAFLDAAEGGRDSAIEMAGPDDSESLAGEADAELISALDRLGGVESIERLAEAFRTLADEEVIAGEVVEAILTESGRLEKVLDELRKWLGWA